MAAFVQANLLSGEEKSPWPRVMYAVLICLLHHMSCITSGERSINYLHAVTCTGKILQMNEALVYLHSKLSQKFCNSIQKFWNSQGRLKDEFDFTALEYICSIVDTMR